LSKEYKSRARLNIFITNISAEVLELEQIHSVYTLRWQIELVFKVWKSIGKIHKVKKMKQERFESYLYAKIVMAHAQLDDNLEYT
jgi:IS4 transposase